MNSKEGKYFNAVEYILNKIESYDERIAQVDTENNVNITFKEISQRIKKFSDYLINNGLKQGDIICVCSHNTIDYCWIILGALYAGTSCYLISSLLKPGELTNALNICKPRLFISIKLNDKQMEVIQSFSDMNYWDIDDCILNTTKRNNMDLKNNAHTYGGENVGLILMSSGSTGFPKGVQLTHNNMIFILRNHDYLVCYGAKVLGMLPFIHCFGLFSILLSLHNGAEVYIMPRFNLNKLIENIYQNKLTHIILVPTLTLAMAQYETAKESLKSVKALFIGGAPISPEQLNFIANTMPGCQIYQAYGMTELTYIASIQNYSENKRSIGKMLPYYTCKIMKKKGEESNSGEIGELCFKGPAVTKGYMNNQSSTENLIDAEGWLHSGDLGYADDDGYYYIVDRMKDIIKYQGTQVSPVEIETLLKQHEGISEVVVIGIPHEKYGEVPRAYVVRKDPSITENEIVKLVQDHMAKPKQLRGGVCFIDSIPKTLTGKIKRHEVKKMFELQTKSFF